MQGKIIISGQILQENDTIFSIQYFQFSGDGGFISVCFSKPMESETTLSSNISAFVQQLCAQAFLHDSAQINDTFHMQNLHFTNADISLGSAKSFTIMANVEMRRITDLWHLPPTDIAHLHAAPDMRQSLQSFT